MNRRDLPALWADLSELTLRCRDAGVSDSTMTYLARARDCLYLESQIQERESLPPLVESNQAKRTAATEAFRNARKLLKGCT